MAQPLYGARDGLPDRLNAWVKRLGEDRSLPWVGLGLIADLKTAAGMLNGEPEASKNVEYDL